MDPLELAATLMRTMAAEIPPGTITPLDHWPRLRSAFESAAAEADDYPALICAAARRLNVLTVRKTTGETIYRLAPADFEGLRDVLTHRALYVTILAQVRQSEARGDGEVMTLELMHAALNGGAE